MYIIVYQCKPSMILVLWAQLLKAKQSKGRLSKSFSDAKRKKLKQDLSPLWKACFIETGWRWWWHICKGSFALYENVKQVVAEHVQKTVASVWK